MNDKEMNQEIKHLRAELAASIAHEKTVEVAPPTGSWDHWPAGWMARRNYTIGLRHRRNDRAILRRKIAKLVAAAKASADQAAGIGAGQKRVKRGTFRRMRDVRDADGNLTGLKKDRAGDIWKSVRNNGDFCMIIELVAQELR
jgi:Zn-dependent M32 family carboxypeptidase